jgi:hypothetical protein
MNKPGILVKSREQWFAEIPGLPLMMANRVALGADPFLISLEWIKTLLIGVVLSLADQVCFENG